LACPVEHAPSTQVPAEQLADAKANEHARPHAPQFAVDVASVVSQPFSALPSQLPKPAVQAPMTHVPLLHVPDAFV
jgi:hypothetical protein